MDPTTPDHSAALLGAARAGEPVAWQCLYRALAPKVAGYLRLQGAHDVDDLVSEVFIGVFRNIASFEGSWEQFRSWVFVIAHRRLTDQRRARGRAPEFIADDPDDTIDTTSRSTVGGDVPDEALSHLSTERVIELCARLVSDQRDVLLLRVVSGFTVEQVADVLAKSEGAVKQLQRRGLAALRRILSREGVPL